MTLRILSLTGLMLTLLVACGTPGPVRYSAPDQPLTDRISVPQRTVAVREVSLPAYATAEQVSVADASGALREQGESLWADDPVREVTLELTGALGTLTGRTVAADPWPFREDPDAVVDVRIEEFVARAGGSFLAKGQYYVAQSDAGRPDRARRFEIVEPFDPEGGIPAIAGARSRVVAQLARQIARNGLR